MPSGQRPTFCDNLTVWTKNPASSSVVRLRPNSTTGPWNFPDSSISTATLAPWENPTTTSQRCAVANSPATRASPGTDTSSVKGAPAIPGNVVATRRTPDNAGSAITRSKERAALAPPGSRRTDRSASSGPAINNSQASRMVLLLPPRGAAAATPDGRTALDQRPSGFHDEQARDASRP